MIYINSTPIEAFINQVKAADNSNSKEVRLDIKQAKNLAYSLGMVMSRINMDNELLLKEVLTSQETIINIDGGEDW